MNIFEFISNNQDKVADVLDIIPVPIFVKDVKGEYLYCNTSFLKYAGIESPSVFLGKTAREVWDKDTADLYEARDAELYANDLGYMQYEAEVKDITGNIRYVAYSKRIWYTANGKIAGIIGVIHDRTHEKILEKELKYRADHDVLTSLPNRRAGIEQLQQILSSGETLSLLLLDYDHFKFVNDNYTHVGGDIVLSELSPLIKSHVGERDLMFRYGGEEFIICLVGVSLHAAGEVARTICNSVRNKELMMPNGVRYTASVSIGVASNDICDVSMEALIKHADEALYNAKSKGRNCVRLYSEAV